MLRLLALALSAAALDPVLYAAEEQQDKEQVVAYFAAARAKDQEEVKEEHAEEATRTTKMYAQLKTASDQFWSEHKSRVTAENAAHAAGQSLFASQKALDQKVAQFGEEEKKQQAAVEASEKQIAELNEELEENATALERMTEKLHSAASSTANLKQELADEREAQAMTHKADVAALHQVEKQNDVMRKQMANVTEKASESVAAARLDAAQARGALKEDTQLLANVRASTEQKVQGLRAEWAAQQKRVQGQFQHEAEALKKLQSDRDELSEVAEAAVKKAESLEARKAKGEAMKTGAESGVEVHEHRHKGHHKHHHQHHHNKRVEPEMHFVAEPEVDHHHKAPQGLIEPHPRWHDVEATLRGEESEVAEAGAVDAPVAVAEDAAVETPKAAAVVVQTEKKAEEVAKDTAAADLSEADAIIAEEDEVVAAAEDAPLEDAPAAAAVDAPVAAAEDAPVETPKAAASEWKPAVHLKFLRA